MWHKPLLCASLEVNTVSHSSKVFSPKNNEISMAGIAAQPLLLHCSQISELWVLAWLDIEPGVLGEALGVLGSDDVERLAMNFLQKKHRPSGFQDDSSAKQPRHGSYGGSLQTAMTPFTYTRLPPDMIVGIIGWPHQVKLYK